MGRIIQNLRIGTKLAITSALGVLLVGFMIGSQMYGNPTVSRSHQSAIVQQSILRDDVEAKTALLGMQVSVRDIRLAGTSADLKKAGDNLAERLKSANNSADEMARLSQSAENRARIEKLKSLTGAYMRGAQQIVAVRSEAIGLGAAGAGSESAARIAKLNDEAIRIAREVTLPMVAELESLAGQIADFAKHRVEQENADSVREMPDAERGSLLVGLCAVLLRRPPAVFPSSRSRGRCARWRSRWKNSPAAISRACCPALAARMRSVAWQAPLKN